MVWGVDAGTVGPIQTLSDIISLFVLKAWRIIKISAFNSRGDMDKQAFFAAVDRAIRNVAESEFRRLAAGMGPEVWYQNVHEALRALDRLRQGIQPNYDDDWVALFYLTWYQASQINLARLMIERLNQRTGNNGLVSNDARSLHVVDFGCGALAMQLAVAWAAAEALENGANVESIRIESYDTSLPMIRLGIQLWREFKLEISRDTRLRTLSDVSEEVIRSRYAKPREGLLFEHPRPETERWLCAFHTVYDDNLEEVKESLSQLTIDLDPTNGILSCHDDNKSRSLLGQASPFDSSKCDGLEEPLTSRIEDLLPEVTLWRRSLNRYLGSAGSVARHRYLDGDVTWKFRPAYGRVCVMVA